MGKKPKKPETGSKKLSMTKRNELNGLVNSLLKLGFLQTINPTEQWNHYLEIHSLLERVRSIESEISVIKRNTKRSGAIEEFIKWCKNNGAQFDGIKISEFPGYEYGLEALKDFKENDIFITIPDKIVFAFEKASPKIRLAAKMVSLIASMPNISLAFFLMVERLTLNSFWRPYFDILPDRYSTVMYFTPAELQELKGRWLLWYGKKKSSGVPTLSDFWPSMPNIQLS